MDAFTQNELIGRNIFKEFLLSKSSVSNIQFTGDLFNPVDVYFNVGDIKVVGEIKRRNAVYNSGMVVEENKLNSIINAAKLNLCLSRWYINIIGDKIYIWTVTAILKKGTKPFLKWQPATTSGNLLMILKLVRLIKVEDADMIYLKSNNEWIKLK